MAFRTFTVKKWKKLANTANGNPVYSFELESAGHTVKGKTKPNAGFVFGIPSVYPGDKINVELSATPSGRVYMTDFARSNPTTRKTAARTQRAAESYVRRPSQITKKAPSKRLKTRRTVNLQSPRGVFPNPRGREGDYEAARELFLFISNDGDLYRLRTTHIIDNLAKKKAKGVFDHEKSLTLWKYLADDGAKKYAKDYGGSFDVPTRKMTAKMLADYYDEHIDEEMVKFGPGKTLRKNPVGRKSIKGLKNFIVQESAFSENAGMKTIGVFAKVEDALEYAKARDMKNKAEKKRRWIMVLEG